MARVAKKMLTAVLAAVMAVCSFASAPRVNAAQNYADAELARAVDLGFGAYKDKDPAVTYAEFFKVLDKAVELADKTKLAAWQKQLPEARKSTLKITRFEAMIVVYRLAQHLGEVYGDMEPYNGSSAAALINKIGENRFWDGAKDPRLLGELDGRARTLTVWYVFGRVSSVSGKTLFDYDEKKNSIRLGDDLTYKEALLVAVRYYDGSDKSLYERWPTAEDAKILADAEKRKQAILNSPTTVTVTGTKYYVSNKGNDDNDGLTPQTAWKTLDKVNSGGKYAADWAGKWVEYDYAYKNPDKRAVLKPGDGVFFQRGGLWRGVLRTAEGVTYSAYGTGEKPRIYGSPENGGGESKWVLVPGTKNIYVFYKDIYDTGAITDGKTALFKKYLALWDGKRYLDTGGKAQIDASDTAAIKKVYATPFDYKTIPNMTLFNDIRYPNIFDFDGAGACYRTQGKLYVRCDTGNPGKLYGSMEFITNLGGADAIAPLY